MPPPVGAVIITGKNIKKLLDNAMRQNCGDPSGKVTTSYTYALNADLTKLGVVQTLQARTAYMMSSKCPHEET